MSRQKLAKQMIGVIGILVFLIGSDVPAAMPVIKPNPSVTFTGHINSSRGIGNGTITFEVSQDGASISHLNISMTDLKSIECSSPGSFSAVKEHTVWFPPNPIQIKKSNFEVAGQFGVGGSSSDIKLKGKFTSPTKAIGTVSIIIHKLVQAGSPAPVTCNFGASEWSAEIK